MKYFFLIYIYCNSLILQAQSATFTTEQIKSDINYLQHQLELKHAGLYTYTDMKTIFHVFDSLQNNIPGPMTDLEFYAYVSPVLSVIKDGHTMIFPNTETINYHNANSLFFPFRILNDGEKMFVELNYSTTDLIPNGSQIVTINGMNSIDLLDRLLSTMMRDGNNPSYPIWILNWWFNEYYSYVFGHPETLNIEYISPDGKQEVTTIKALPKEEIFANRESRYPNRQFSRTYGQKPGTAVTLTMDTKNSTAILKIKDWDLKILKNTYHQKLVKEIDKCFDTIFKNNIQNLIIDIRDNQGGNMVNSIHVLSYLLDTTFNMVDNFYKVDQAYSSIDDVRNKKVNGEKSYNKKVRKQVFLGKVYVLINGGCFSNSGLFASTLKRHNRAIFVGEESGGSIYSLNGLVKTIILPETKLRVELPTLRFSINEEDKNTGHGLIPDYSIHPTIQDLVEGRDVILEKALALIKNQ